MAGNGNDHGNNGDLNASTLPAALARQLRALRIAHPEAELQTKAVRFEDDSVVFHAVISLPDGGASAHGSARGSGEGVVELAESRAIARALGALGFADADLADRPARAPRTIADNGDGHAPAEPPEPPTQAHPAPPTPTPLPARPPAERRPAPPIRTTPPIDINANRDRPGAAPHQDPRPSAMPNADDEPGMENYSWTEFWKWARSRGFNNKADLEALIGQPIESLNPMEVRALVVAKRGES